MLSTCGVHMVLPVAAKMGNWLHGRGVTVSLQRLRGPPAVGIGTSYTKPPLKTTYYSFYLTIDTLEDDFPSCLALGD